MAGLNFNVSGTDPGTASDGTTGGPGTLSYAIAQINARDPAGGPYTITLTGNVTLQGPLSPILGSVTIVGNNHTIDAGGATRIFFVGTDTATMTTAQGDPASATSIISQRQQVTIQNVTLTGGTAQGGAGGISGGGGLGAGGALFVNQSADVTLSNVSFSGDSAVGGAGTGASGIGIGGGGGGGLGGNGGHQGGGGGIFGNGGGGGGGGGIFGNGAYGGGGFSGDGGNSRTGDAGTLPIFGLSGSGGNSDLGYSGGNVGGGGGYGAYSGGGGFGGGAGTTSGGNGGFGGGGGDGRFGNGGSGGFGGGGGEGNFGNGGGGGFGGGGGGVTGNGGSHAGDGGFGGGGGGGNGYGQSGIVGGAGGFGGGGGGSDGTAGTFGGASGFGASASTPTGGGGGAGLGGAVFVASGGTLTVSDGGTLAGTVTGGNSGAGVAASVFGAGIFYQGNADGTASTLTFGAGNETIASAIADYIGSGGINPNGGTNGADQGGSVGLALTGPGTVTLQAANTYSGGTTIAAGSVLDLDGTAAAPATAGSGAISGDGAVAVTGDAILDQGNTYTGGTTITAGTLTATHAESLFDTLDALGTGAVTLNGGTLALTDASGAVENAIVVDAPGGTIDASGAGSSTTILDSGITGTGPLSLVAATPVSGVSNEFYLQADNSGFTGPLAISGGIVVADVANALPPTAAVTVAAGATLDIDPQAGVTAQSVGSLAGAGTVTASVPGSSDPTGAATLTTGGDNSSTTFSGTLVDGTSTFALVKTGTGTFTLSNGASTYTGGTTIAGGTLDLAAADTVTGGAVTAGPAGTGAITFFGTGDHPATLALEAAAQPGDGGTFGTTLADFGAASESLDLKGFTFNPLDIVYVSDGRSLTVTGGLGGTQTETFALTNGALAYTAQADSAGTGTLITAVCYAGGTGLRVRRDGVATDVTVEDLVVGDLAVTAAGEARPIRWLGHRTVDCAAHPAPRKIWPVRIAKDAFGSNKPDRDLFVSPGHALCVDVVGKILVPAASLVNGSTIAQVAVDEVTYWHVELDSHDVLLANGLPAESYRDTGNRSFFAANGTSNPDPAPCTRADVCHPFHHKGPLVDAVRAQLAARAATLGWAANRDANLHLVVDGKVVRPFGAGDTALFLFPATARDVRLVSNTFVPADRGGTDTRRLGVRIHGLSLSGTAGAPRRVSLDDPALADQFHASERENARAWRWTQGDLALAPSMWSGLTGDVLLHLTHVFNTVRGYLPPAAPPPASTEEKPRLYAVA